MVFEILKSQILGQSKNDYIVTVNSIYRHFSERLMILLEEEETRSVIEMKAIKEEISP